MPWVRFDDGFPIHRKVEPLSDGAYRLHTTAICWSSRNLTDGCIPKSDLLFVAPRTMKRPEKFVKELVERGLWITTDDGWQIHDYLDYQPSKEQVNAERQKKTERQKRWREKKKTSNVDGGVDASTDASRDGSRDAAPSRPVPTRPAPRVNKNSCSSAPPPNDSEPLPLIPEPPHKPEPGSDDDPDWCAFWAAYPRKAKKPEARKSWVKALKGDKYRAPARPIDIITAARRYANDPNRVDQYTAMPTTWLNQARWQDDPLPERAPVARNGSQHQAFRNPDPSEYYKGL